jgi:2-polyprenyl-3-methyl-5-hydroxy-6-metoxy-1,4-benzoquinol methylase
MLELGCYDGRLIEYCPTPPSSYQGFDAGREGGLEAAQQKHAKHPSWRFSQATEPKHMDFLEPGQFNVGAAMETLEHIPPDMLEGYLAQFSRLLNGHMFVTVPNEKGLVFLTKHIVKSFKGSQLKYNFSEVVNATLGRSHAVARDEHKGFDYAVLMKQIAKYFDIVEAEALPHRALPKALGFTIGIVARTKRAK